MGTAAVIDLRRYRERRAEQKAEKAPPPMIPVVYVQWVPVIAWMPVWF